MTDARPRVMAVIPFYKRRDQLDQCLAALSASTTPVEPWIHDNSEKNLGFTRAINLGLNVATDRAAEFVLVLNQDCYVRPGAVAAMLDLMARHPQCGIVGLKQLHSFDTDLIVHGGCREAFPFGVHDTGRVSLGQHAVDRMVPWVNGAAMLARMSAVRDFGFMDANFVMIASDSDWCYTARARGWEVWYCAAAEALHEMGVSLAQSGLSPAMKAVFESDQNWWRTKWISGLFRHVANSPAVVAVRSRPMPG